MQRLLLQSSKLKHQPKVAQEYVETFENMKRNGHVESIDENGSSANKQNPIHYITHFLTEQKFRVVCNGTLRINGVSTNDMLYRKPMFLESLMGFLIRFRQHAFGVTGDIRNMFFQVKLHPRDRNMLRFLPLKNHEVARNDEVRRFTVMSYGIICVPACWVLYYVYCCKELCQRFSKYCKKMEKDFYVDDLIA